MKAIVGETCHALRSVIQEMMLNQQYRESEFDLDWVRTRKWKVVPVERSQHLSDQEIANIVSALNATGSSHCLALATEPLNPLPECFSLALSADDFYMFNQECGLFRYLLTDETHSWAISCNEWYNLYAGPVNLLELLLGKPIDSAWQDYMEFINQPRMDPDGALHESADRYLSLLDEKSP